MIGTVHMLISVLPLNDQSAASRQKAYREIHIIDQSTYNLICHCQNEKCGDS
jgi:hypothetical protein